MTATTDLAVVGGGVLGLFHAYHSANAGYRVAIFEKDPIPRAATVRNFGMVIPSGMMPGSLLEMALRSAEIYRDLAANIGLQLLSEGTLYVAETPLEARVLREFADIGPARGYRCRLLDRREAIELNPRLRRDYVAVGLHFLDDLRIDPRTLPRLLLELLAAKGVAIHCGKPVVSLESTNNSCTLTTGDGVRHHAAKVVVASGAEMAMLFPKVFAKAGLDYCKLQMIRTAPQAGERMRVSLGTGLSIRRYRSFAACPSHAELVASPADAELLERGIHILVTQDADGRLVIGDSHEHAPIVLDDHLDGRTESCIVNEAKRIVDLPTWEVDERWQGGYLIDPVNDYFLKAVAPNVTLITGIGGKGMTIAPALSERLVRDHLFSA